MIIFGFLVWLIPFLASLIIFPIRTSMRPLFESIMPLVITVIVIILVYQYLKQVDINLIKEGITIGFVWFVISIAIDLFLFLPPSPMQMSFADYMMDIGLTYVLIPVITTGMGFMAHNKST